MTSMNKWPMVANKHCNWQMVKCILACHWSFVLYDVIFYRYYKLISCLCLLIKIIRSFLVWITRFKYNKITQSPMSPLSMKMKIKNWNDYLFHVVKASSCFLSFWEAFSFHQSLSIYLKLLWWRTQGFGRGVPENFYTHLKPGNKRLLSSFHKGGYVPLCTPPFLIIV